MLSLKDNFSAWIPMATATSCCCNRWTRNFYLLVVLDYYVLEDNSALSANLASKQWPTREFINFTVGGGYSEKKFLCSYKHGP
jgi:hypothetical protein